MKIKLTLTTTRDKPVDAEFVAPLRIAAIIKTLELFGTCRVTMYIDEKHEEMIFPDIGTETWVEPGAAKRKRHLVKSWIDKLILQTITRGLYK